MDAVAPDFEEAALSSEYRARGAALSRALEKVDAELAVMDAALAAGAFRLACFSSCISRLTVHEDMSASSANASMGSALICSGVSVGRDDSAAR